jgi:hypothetical protein
VFKSLLHFCLKSLIFIFWKLSLFVSLFLSFFFDSPAVYLLEGFEFSSGDPRGELGFEQILHLITLDFASVLFDDRQQVWLVDSFEALSCGRLSLALVAVLGYQVDPSTSASYIMR